jgi:putrescine transport system substrate-binding protein
MRRILTVLTVISAIGSGAASAADQRLTLYNWSDYLPPEILDGFAAETGIAVVQDTYSEGAVAEARLIAGGTGYDLAIVSSESLGRLAEAGALAYLDRGRLDAAPALDPEAMARVDGLHADVLGAVPYLEGFTGIAYHEAEIAARMPDAPRDSWAMIFDPAIVSRFADCGVAIVDSPEEVVSAALAWLGRDPRSTAPEDLDAALEAIAAIAPHVRVFGSEHADLFSAEEVCLALTWSTEAIDPDIGLDETPYAFATPREGAIIWFDLFVLPADSPDPDLARRFVDYVLRPENIAEAAAWNYAVSPVPAARDHLPAALREHPLLDPPPGVLARSFAVPPRDGATRADLARRWTLATLGL